MLIGGYVGENAPNQFESVKVGDAVFVTKKETWERGRTTTKQIEAWVTKRQGMRVRVMPEDRSGEMWYECSELDKVVPDGGEELQTRAARIAEQKRIEEEKKRKEAERKAAELAEKRRLEAAQQDRVDKIKMAYLTRGTAARDWVPAGKYNWTESPVITDQTKDCYRIVWYEINTELDYGAVVDPPTLNLARVEELKVEHEARKKAEKEEVRNLRLFAAQAIACVPCGIPTTRPIARSQPYY